MAVIDLTVGKLGVNAVEREIDALLKAWAREVDRETEVVQGVLEIIKESGASRRDMVERIRNLAVGQREDVQSTMSELIQDLRNSSRQH